MAGHIGLGFAIALGPLADTFSSSHRRLTWLFEIPDTPTQPKVLLRRSNGRTWCHRLTLNSSRN